MLFNGEEVLITDEFRMSLMYRSSVTDVLMYRFAKVTIYFGFAFIVTILDIFKLIIDYQVDHQMLSSAIWDFYNVNMYWLATLCFAFVYSTNALHAFWRQPVCLARCDFMKSWSFIDKRSASKSLENTLTPIYSLLTVNKSRNPKLLVQTAHPWSFLS